MSTKIKNKRNIALLAIIMLTALLLTASLSVITESSWAQDSEEPWSGWPLAGSWITWVPPEGPVTEPLIVQETLTPLDPAGDRLAYRQQYTNGDPTFLSIYPEADNMSHLIGEAVKTGRNTYEYTIIGYGFKNQPADRGQLKYIIVTNGTMTLINRNTRENTLYLSLYGPDKDVNPVDGLPDEGAEPDLCLGPFGGVTKRVQLMPPCVPPPPPEPAPE